MAIGRRGRKPAIAVAGVVALVFTGLFGVGLWPASAAVGGDLDQCANGEPSAPELCNGGAWQNGNLNANNSSYFEGDGVPFRFELTGLAAGAVYAADFEYDTVHGGAHAYDYLVSYDYSEAAPGNDPCAGVLSAAACTAGPTTVPITRDSTLPAGIGDEPGQVVSVWNGSSIGFAYLVEGGHDTSGASDKKTSFRITFTATAETALIAWAGHIADSADWAPQPTAINISGSPYHMRSLGVNGSGGQQDRSLKADAVLRHDAGSLAIDKSGPASVAHGGTITYTFSVTYTPGPDGSAAKDIAVSDPKCTSTISGPTGDTNDDALLQGTETWTYSCSTTAPATHTAGEADPIPNEATVTGTDLDGDALVPKTDGHSVDLVHAAGTLTIVKGGPASAAHGEQIAYTFDVTYDAGVDGSPAKDIVVSDPKCASATAGPTGDTNRDSLLQEGETWRYACTFTVPGTHAAGEANPIPNEATVNGKDLDGDALVPDTDDHSVAITHAPGTLALAKRADKTAVAHGGVVTYTFEVMYTPAADGAPATGVAVSDPKCTSAITGPAGDDGDGLLEAGEAWSYTCTMTVAGHAAGEADPIENQATVAAADVDGDPIAPAVSNKVLVDVLHGATLVIDKAADKASATVGDTVTYTYVLTNTTGDPVDNVVVSDDKCSPVTFGGGDANGDGKLQVGESWSYTCAQAVSEAGPLTNLALATGKDVLGAVVSATDSVTVQVTRPVTVLGVRIPLPRTGSELRGVAMLGGSLVLLGLSILFVSRRWRSA